MPKSPFRNQTTICSGSSTIHIANFAIMVTPNMTVPNTKNRPRIPRTPKTNIIGNTFVCTLLHVSLAINVLIYSVIFSLRYSVFWVGTAVQ